MFKKFSSFALVGVLTLSLSACSKTETVPAEDKENVGINVKVEDKMDAMSAPATDKENVGISIEVKDSMTK